MRDHGPRPADDAARAEWISGLTERLNANPAQRARYLIEDDGNGGITANRKVHGLTHVTNFLADFFESGEYRKLAEFSGEVQARTAGTLTIRRGERESVTADFTAAYDWLISDTRRTMHIQRYKGLGEMNPEQLFETTLDPTQRRLVQVQIEDAVAADQMFTTLMGEHVEPRREFIEKHALLVDNLDV